MVQFRTPNLLGAVAQGTQLRQQREMGEARNALSGAVQQYGGRSPQAMNALAGVDPVAAMQMQQPDPDARRKSALGLVQGVMAAPEEMRPQAYAAALAQAQQMGMDVNGMPEQYPGDVGLKIIGGLVGMEAAERSEFERLLQSVPEEQRQQVIAMKLGLEPDANTALRVGAQQNKRPTFRAATPEEAAQYGAAAGQVDEATGRFYPNNPPSGMSIESDGAGGIRVTQGPGVTQQKPFTEGQSKDVVYATRARGALEVLDPLADRLSSLGDRAANFDPTGLVRGAVQSDDFQIAQNAGNEFLQAILRKDTGAAITSQEQELYGQTYLPQPGDNPAVIQEKAAARQRAIAAIEAGMSPAQMIAQERGINAAKQATRPPDIEPEIWEAMPPEDRELFGGQGAENPSPAGIPEPAADVVGEAIQTGAATPVQLASAFVGMNETENAAAISSFIRNTTGETLDPRETAWCAAFLNAVLHASGKEGTGKLTARSFLQWGAETQNPTQGDVAVFWREDPDSWKGHVGLFDGYEMKDGKPHVRVIGGNQNDGVNAKLYPADRLLGFRTARNA